MWKRFGARRIVRHHRRRHEVRVRPRAGRGRRRASRRGPHHPDRRSADAGFGSRAFWPGMHTWRCAQPSFDKQFVRDYLERIRWNKQPPVPSLPTTWWRRRAKSTSRPFAASPAGSSTDRDQRSARASGRRDGRPQRPVRRCGPRVREAVHRARPEPVRRQPDEDRLRARHAPQHADPKMSSIKIKRRARPSVGLPDLPDPLLLAHFLTCLTHSDSAGTPSLTLPATAI